MKTSTLPIKAFLAALAAIALLPVGPVAASIAFTSTGLIAMLASDYGRDPQPLAARASVVPFELAGRGAPELDRAA
jgi:hypothetical protein